MAAWSAKVCRSVISSVVKSRIEPSPSESTPMICPLTASGTHRIA